MPARDFPHEAAGTERRVLCGSRDLRLPSVVSRVVRTLLHDDCLSSSLSETE